jgi:hypothetical protein
VFTSSLGATIPRAAQSGLKGMLVAIPAPGYALRKVEEKPRIG